MTSLAIYSLAVAASALILVAYVLFEWGQANHRADEALRLLQGEVCEDDDCDC
jgi:hypothetical protein